MADRIYLLTRPPDRDSELITDHYAENESQLVQIALDYIINLHGPLRAYEFEFDWENETLMIFFNWDTTQIEKSATFNIYEIYKR